MVSPTRHGGLRNADARHRSVRPWRSRRLPISRDRLGVALVRNRAGLEVAACVERPFGLGCAQHSARDGERFDDQPRVTFAFDPGLGVESFTQIAAVGIDMVQRAAHEHRLAFFLGDAEPVETTST